MSEPFLAALPRAPYQPLVEIDAAAFEADSLGNADARPVKQLDEGAVAQRARAGAVRGSDQALGLPWRERPRQRAHPPGERELGGRVVGAGAEELEVAEEAPRRRRPPRDRRRGEAFGPQLRRVALELAERRQRERLVEKTREAVEVAPIGVDRPRRAPRCEQREERFEL